MKERTGKLPDSLYKAMCDARDNDESLPYTLSVSGAKPTYVTEALVDETAFWNVCEYQLVILDENRWGVVELKPGKLGEYYLLMTDNDAVFGLKESVVSGGGGKLQSISISELRDAGKVMDEISVLTR